MPVIPATPMNVDTNHGGNHGCERSRLLEGLPAGE